MESSPQIPLHITFASDQVCELATPQIAEGVLVELDCLEDSPAHIPTTESTIWSLDIMRT